MALFASLLPLAASALGADCAKPAAAAASAESHLAEARCWLEAGQSGAALLAVERALAVRPDDAEAAALREQLVGRLEAVRPRERRSARGWIAFQTGYDSNANLGTDATDVRVPLRLRLPAIDTGDLRKRSSPFLGTHGGFEGTVPLTERERLRFVGLAGARLSTRAFVTANYAVEAHAEHRGERLRAGLWLASDQRWINQYRVIDATTLGARSGTAVSPRDEVELFAATTDKRLPYFDLATREQRLGVSLIRPASGLRLTLFAGTERAQSETPRIIKDQLVDADFLDRDFAGAQASASRPLGRGRFDLYLSYARSRYRRFSEPFLVNREDEWREFDIAYQHPLGRAWRLGPRFIWQDNRSNIVVAAYRRVQGLIELRRDF